MTERKTAPPMARGNCALKDSRNMPFLWLHLELDDAGLTPYEMRVYIHVVRRAGKENACWESLPNMASHCDIGIATIKRALKGLIGKNMLDKHPRNGDTSIYRITDISDWHIDCHRPSSEMTQVMREPGGSSEMNGGVAHTEQGGSSEMTYKVDPFKQIPEVDPSKSEPARQNGHSYSKTKPYHPGLTPYQGSTEFMEERPWMVKWHRANPVYAKGFVDFMRKYLETTESYRDGAANSNAIGYLGEVNPSKPELVSAARLQRLNALWMEFLEPEVDKLMPQAPKDGRPILSDDQLDQLRVVRDSDGILSAEEMMLITPGLKINNPNWSNVRFQGAAS